MPETNSKNLSKKWILNDLNIEISISFLYNQEKQKEMDTMDTERMKVLDRHAFLFALVHSLFVVSLAYDFISFY